VQLDIIGDGPERLRLGQLADSLGVTSQVTFRGLLTFDAVVAAMADATLLVHPSIGLGDAVPTVIKEAMALGTPIIGSAVAGIPELLDGGRCGVLVPPCDAHALAGAIDNLLDDGPRRSQYAAAARRFAERQFDLWRNGSALATRLKSARKAA
jgi:glycosyltransferase involved in cell wall biosynthesis